MGSGFYCLWVSLIMAYFIFAIAIFFLDFFSSKNIIPILLEPRILFTNFLRFFKVLVLNLYALY